MPPRPTPTKDATWLEWLDYYVRPPSGRRRELWDASIFLGLVNFISYVATTPPPQVAVALNAPLTVVTERQLGWAMVGACTVGFLLSYGPREWLDFGYRLPRTICLFMAANFVAGILYVYLDGVDVLGWFTFSLVEPDLSHEEKVRVYRSAWILALLYGTYARRLARDNRAWWERP